MKKILSVALLVLAAVVANPTISMNHDLVTSDPSPPAMLTDQMSVVTLTAASTPGIQMLSVQFGPTIASANICDDAAGAGWRHVGLNAGCMMFYLMMVDHYGDYVP